MKVLDFTTPGQNPEEEDAADSAAIHAAFLLFTGVSEEEESAEDTEDTGEFALLGDMGGPIIKMAPTPINMGEVVWEEVPPSKLPSAKLSLNEYVAALAHELGTGEGRIRCFVARLK